MDHFSKRIRHIARMVTNACADECEKITGAFGHPQGARMVSSSHAINHQHSSGFISRTTSSPMDQSVKFASSPAASAIGVLVCVSVMYRRTACKTSAMVASELLMESALHPDERGNLPRL